ncbi:MAG TPA: DUF2460 domain-containing protein [Bryobacteraceae bacterium]|nr:DUF2460 domain-containing protein [Bryobacteraceae bacterium]
MTFPVLKTGAVMQYPGAKELRVATDVVQFVDGGEQRYRDFGSALRRWLIRLDLLDEGELAEIEGFFTDCQGAFGNFAFTDPWDGTEYPNCSLEQDSIETVLEGELRGGTLLVVKENRS